MLAPDPMPGSPNPQPMPVPGPPRPSKLWQQAVKAFIHVLALNAWLANERPECKPPVEGLAIPPDLDWQPVVINQTGGVR